MSTDCIFCKILAGEIPSEKVAETERAVAIRDIAPKAPVHVLVIPRTHVANVAALAEESPEDLAEMARLAQQVADEHCDGEYRLIFNTGASAGQTVFHVHGHIMNGGSLGWSE